MPRFVLVHGVPGHLVGHPSRGGREFVGKIQRSAEACAAIAAETGKCSLVDRFDDRAEVVELKAGDATILKAVRAGHLKQTGTPQEFPNMAAAVAKLMPEPSATQPAPGPKKAKSAEAAS